MPELPEVETVRATLEHQIVGEKIVNVEVRCLRIISPSSKDDFCEKLKGQVIREVKRYGKYLFFILDKVTILSHLRMEGKFFIKKTSDEIEKHEHIIFTMASGMSLRYHDTRKFGIMKIIETTNMEALMKVPEIKKLGKEGTDSSFTPQELLQKLKGKTEPIKTALLDQTIICGLGNIYVDEVCFMSRIHPAIPANLITPYEAKLILSNSRKVLANAIECGGTTIRSYTSSLGVTGRFQLNLLVHTRENKQCYVCGSIIEKTRVGGRGTNYCPHCQNINHPYVVGVTGGIGMGKSLVSEYINSKGYLVFDADLISKNLTLTNTSVLEQIKESFGSNYFIKDSLDRKKIGELIFSDHTAREKLNAIIHPLVKQQLLEKIYENQTEKIVFIDVPLLYEAGFDELCNFVICVFTDQTTNISRLKERDHATLEETLNKINSQLDINVKKSMANFIIDNSSDICYTYKQVDRILEKLGKER